MRFRRSARIVLTAVLAAGLTACSGSGSGAQGDDIDRDVIRFAEFPGVVPNWILPITDPGHNGSPNTMQFSFLMWRPLFWRGNGAEPTLDERLALAEEPAYADDKRSVTVKLHDYNWSDGKPITSRDVEFWINLIKHNPTRWSGYVKGNIPDNIDTFEAVDDKTFKLTLTEPVSADWFTGNQLSLIVPLPHHAWGNGDDDRTEAGAKAVLDRLMEESKKPAEYATNPLWKTVSGPWTLSKYTTDGHITFVPNNAYTGPAKPTVKRFEQVPFTTEDAAFNALVAGDIDVGPLPFKNLNQRERLEKDGYTFVPWRNWTVNYLALNYNNPETGPLVRQTYIRQAMQSLIDQPLIIDKVFNGQGAQQYGPIPLEPANPYATVKNAPFPYDENKAVTLLRDNGWDVKPGGQTTCKSPGTGPGQCGEGIEAGTPLAFEAIVTSNRRPVLLEMQSQQSVFQQKAGIAFQVQPTPFAQIITEAFAPCTREKPDGCPWQTAVWGGGSNVQPYPTGEQLFHSTGSSNAGHYSDPKADELIEASITGGPEELKAFEEYLAQQVPVLWVPNPSYQLSMVRNGLQGADGQNPYSGVTPELWNWKK
ncbi:peptide ABC transporter substrate-binding protein [Nonomuraea sp. K274]|uniref:Peptide ABC transporter substrate-binding protein n=1 Tax=Nonomuraea cypriaca TaxID=1187855 RepID=A0A931ADN7_9ACTN|nr:peptide ABC transporter substrate-binding protein [Nonomuraea cypriaca]MBF8188613.1 peptide ABC transporter substrate-binding protein [Nonomuraea cypriaca]